MVRLLLQDLIHQSAKGLDPRSSPHNNPGLSRDGRPTLPGIATLPFRPYSDSIRRLCLGSGGISFMATLTCLNARSSHPYSTRNPSGPAVCLPTFQHKGPRSAPAFSANRGSRGKIQCSDCQGLIAAWCNIRHTVLRLIFLPRHLGSPHQVGQRLATEWFFWSARRLHKPSRGSTLDPVGEKAAFRPRPA